MATIDEFRASLITFGERVQRVREHVKNEEATKVALILPFIAALGYDHLDPTEVAAEHAADFSEKYRNRVDYAILRDMKPIIAIECKCLGGGGGRKDDRGQLKSYFNAAKSVKLGILTDGVRYEFFVDSNEANLMDDDPFLDVDFEKVAKAQISDTALEGLFALAKGNFDPDTVAENARRSIIHRAFTDYLAAQFSEPTGEFTRFLLKENAIKHVRANALDSYRLIAKAAFNDVFTSHVLRRLDISEGIPKIVTRSIAAQEPSAEVAAPPSPPESAIKTTAAELEAFEAIRRRLAFLSAGRKDLFDAVAKVQYRDYQGKMAVFYELERKGRLVDLIETRDGKIRFAVADGGDTTQVTDLDLIEDRLKTLFERRVAGA